MTASSSLELGAGLLLLPNMPIKFTDVGIDTFAQKRPRRDSPVTLSETLVLPVGFVWNTRSSYFQVINC